MAKSFLHNLIHPSQEFSPVPFWFFNDAPERKEIEKQFADFKEKGVDALVLHPRIGIPETIPYLSEAFFDAVKMIVEIAAGLNMKIVLYDEGMYPSGSAHGMVVAANPDFAAKGITLTDCPNGREIISVLPGGRWIVKGFTGGTIRGIHFGEDDGEAGAPKAADILNPEAVALFIRLTHDRYAEVLNPYFGTTVIGFFTDEPCALGRNAENFCEWADGMESEIIEGGGRLEELEALFLQEENATTKLYHQLVKRHLRETFYGALSKWCSDHNIALMGHPAQSDDIEEELYFHIPGQDLILRRVEPKTGGLAGMDSVQAKLSADIARHLGRRRNANECFGVCNRNMIPWYFTGEDMKWYLDWLGFRGVNLFIPHAFYYSIAGKRKEERPPDVGPHNIWWRHYRKFSDYIKRLSFLMTDSVNKAKVAVLCDNNHVPWREVAALYENQISFHYLPVKLLPECTEKDGELLYGRNHYETLLDPFGLAEEGLREKVRILTDTEELQSGADGLWAQEPCPDLRICPLEKEGISMYLLSNEGETKICTKLYLQEDNQEDGQQQKRKEPVFIDLWKGKIYQTEWEDVPGGKRLKFQLEPCQTCLILPDGKAALVQTEEEHILPPMLPVSCSPFQSEKPCEDWTVRFALVKQERNKAIYEYDFKWNGTDQLPTFFSVRGEEMVECFCNGAFVDVSFWGQHRFDIAPFLQKGNNRVRMEVTGNAANIYEDAGIFFGLEGEKKHDNRRKAESI